MNKKRLGILLWLLCVAPVFIPGCGSSKKSLRARRKSAGQEKTNVLATTVDILGEHKLEKLVESGVISGERKKKKPPVKETSELLEAKKTSQETKELLAKEEKLEPTPSKTAEVPAPLAFLEGEDTIEFNFENADLEQLVHQISSLFNINFISDDSVTPTPQGAKVLKGNKISFKTQQPLSRKDAWNLFISFLDVAGLAVVPESNPRFMRITGIETAKRSALQCYIGVSPDMLPDNDQIIRYVYFVENAAIETIKTVVDALRSQSSSMLQVLSELKAFIITDKAYNIKSLMNIVKELDQVNMPQSMSVLKLRRVDATEVKKLYDTLIGVDEKTAAATRLFPQLRKQPSSQYFPDNTRIIPEPRTNSLILLGPIDAIKRIEQFITEQIDIPQQQPYSPLFVLPLRYADATTVANIMNEVTQFGKNTEAGKTGGVRGGDKYMRPILFTPEPETNRIVVKGDYEDYMKAKEVIAKLDAPQPQVAIEVLLLSLTATNLQELGAALRSREPGTGTQLFGNEVKFQTTGLFAGTTPQGVVQNTSGPGVLRLLGNLLNLVNFAQPGSSIVSLGDTLSVWGILQALESITAVQVLANPFLVATNKTKAQVVLGEIHRAVMGTVIGTSQQNVLGDIPARLEVHVTPQINSDGMIVMDLQVLLQQFVGAANPNNVVRTERRIDTKTILSDKEVLALGGLIRNTTTDALSKVPILGDIPIIGWLFKNRLQSIEKENLLILVSAHIMRPEKEEVMNNFTNDRVYEYHECIDNIRTSLSTSRDPVDKWFFRTRAQKDEITNVEDFIFRHEAERKGDTTPLNAHGETGVVPSIKPIETAQNTKRSNQAPTVVAERSKKSLLDLIEEPTPGVAPCS